MNPINKQGWLPVAIALGGLLLLVGCKTGPEYQPPQASVPVAFANSPTNAATMDEAALATWWKGFGDAKLDDLVEQAVAHNHDLRIATANLQEARALRRQAGFDLAPTVQANGGYANSLRSEAATSPGTPRSLREMELYDASFDATWELDFFGRARRSVEAAEAQVEAFEASQQDVLVSVTAEVVRNYAELRGLRNQLAVARKNAEVQRQTLKITQDRLEGGRGTDFDVARSSSLLNLTLATIPPLEGAIRKTTYRLAVICGRPPAELTTEFIATGSLPATRPVLALADPAAMLRRRPDIRAVERTLAAQTASLGVVTADLFPRVTFQGSVGLQAETFTGLGGGGAGAWSFGPRITWAALDLGRVRARITAADARIEAALARYELVVLAALEETEGALVDFSDEQERLKFLNASAKAGEKALGLAQQRYEAGTADFLTVLDAQRTLLEAEDRLAVSQTRAVTALVAVYKSLGGGVPVIDVTRTR